VCVAGGGNILTDIGAVGNYVGCVQVKWSFVLLYRLNTIPLMGIVLKEKRVAKVDSFSNVFELAERGYSITHTMILRTAVLGIHPQISAVLGI
jgi:hypothetical protein